MSPLLLPCLSLSMLRSQDCRFLGGLQPQCIESLNFCSHFQKTHKNSKIISRSYLDRYRSDGEINKVKNLDRKCPHFYCNVSHFLCCGRKTAVFWEACNRNVSNHSISVVIFKKHTRIRRLSVKVTDLDRYRSDGEIYEIKN